MEEQTPEGSRSLATRSEHSPSMSLCSLAGELVNLELGKGEGRAIGRWGRRSHAVSSREW